MAQADGVITCAILRTDGVDFRRAYGLVAH
jgi:hypothetical protein